ncbi:MAG: hypothetical protein ACPHCJ_03040 [Oceanococcaceae bacterium]
MNLYELELQAEKEKLNRLLQLEDSVLQALDHVGVEGMRRLRHSVEARIFDKGARRFTGLARSSKLLPARVSALIAQKALGPRLAAQVTGLLEPELAVGLAKHISTEFQADICVYLDPRRAGPVLRAMPLPLILETSSELVAREEFMTMARFVEDLEDHQIQAVSEVLAPLPMLWIGFYVESGTRLSYLIGTLSDAQLMATMEAAAEHGLWPQSLAMMLRADRSTHVRTTHLLAWADSTVPLRMLEAAQELDLWQPIATLMGSAEESDLRRLEARLRPEAPEALQRLESEIQALQG